MCIMNVEEYNEVNYYYPPRLSLLKCSAECSASFICNNYVQLSFSRSVSLYRAFTFSLEFQLCVKLSVFRYTVTAQQTEVDDTTSC